MKTTFASLLRAARAKKGWTPEELGERAGVHPQVIRKYELGERTWPRLDIAAKIAKALGIKLDSLVP